MRPYKKEKRGGLGHGWNEDLEALAQVSPARLASRSFKAVVQALDRLLLEPAASN